MRWNPIRFAKGFTRTPLRGGIVMLAVTVCLVLAFGVTFAAAIFGPEGVRGRLPPWVIVLAFAILSLVAWSTTVAALPARFSILEISGVCLIGVSPVLLGLLYQYGVLIVSGPGCVGGSIFVLVIGSLAVIGAAAAVLVGSLFRQSP